MQKRSNNNRVTNTHADDEREKKIEMIPQFYTLVLWCVKTSLKHCNLSAKLWYDTDSTNFGVQPILSRDKINPKNITRYCVYESITRRTRNSTKGQHFDRLTFKTIRWFREHWKRRNWILLCATLFWYILTLSLLTSPHKWVMRTGERGATKLKHIAYAIASFKLLNAAIATDWHSSK